MAGRVPRELMVLVERMTNWQRNQWARAGYPVDPKRVEAFLKMSRPA